VEKGHLFVPTLKICYTKIVKILSCKNLGKYFLLLLVGVFLFTSIFGLSYMVMDMDSNGVMTRCPFISSEAVICNMSPLEHISAWQNIFTTLPQKDYLELFLFLLLIIFIVYSMWCFFTASGFYRIYNYFIQRTKRLFVPDYLQEAFSSGILNPKIF